MHIIRLSIFFFLAIFGVHYTHAASEDNGLSILFVGDTDFGESYQARLESEGKTNILKQNGYDYSINGLQSLLKNVDLVIANLETVLTSPKRSALADIKPYIHWSDPVRTAETLRKNGVRAVSLANNHSLDHGPQGLLETQQALSLAGITSFGAGANAQDAAQPFSMSLRQSDSTFRLSVIGGFWHKKKYAEQYDFYAGKGKPGVNDWIEATALVQVRALRAANKNDFIVAFPHWGNNYKPRNDIQTRMAHGLIDAGADMVIGHGAHLMQEIEQYRGKWIIYNIGNFVSNSPGRYRKYDELPFSAAARLDIIDNGEGQIRRLRLYPIASNNRLTNYQPRLVSDEEFARIREASIVGKDQPSSPNPNIVTDKDTIGSYLEMVLNKPIDPQRVR